MKPLGAAVVVVVVEDVVVNDVAVVVGCAGFRKKDDGVESRLTGSRTVFE